MHDHAHDRDPNQCTDLSIGVEDRGRSVGVLPVTVAEDAAGHSGDGDRCAEVCDRDEDIQWPRRQSTIEHGDSCCRCRPDRREYQPRAQRDDPAIACYHPGTDEVSQRVHGHQWQKIQAGGERARLAFLLVVERHQEERAEDFKVDEQADGVDAKECRVVQQCARQQRLSRAPLMTREGSDRQYGNDCRREDARRIPADARPLDQNVGQPAERKGAVQMCCQMQGLRVAGRHGEMAVCKPYGQHAQRQVQPENGAPSQPGDHEAAHEWA